MIYNYCHCNQMYLQNNQVWMHTPSYASSQESIFIIFAKIFSCSWWVVSLHIHIQSKCPTSATQVLNWKWLNWVGESVWFSRLVWTHWKHYYFLQHVATREVYGEQCEQCEGCWLVWQNFLALSERNCHSKLWSKYLVRKLLIRTKLYLAYCNCSIHWKYELLNI